MFFCIDFEITFCLLDMILWKAMSDGVIFIASDLIESTDIGRGIR